MSKSLMKQGERWLPNKNTMFARWLFDLCEVNVSITHYQASPNWQWWEAGTIYYRQFSK